MIRRCEFCGREENEYWMDTYNTGQKQIWVCGRCKRHGIREVNASEAFKKRSKWKENEQK